MEGRKSDQKGMHYVNRLSDYFREMDEIAKRDPVEAIKLKNEHLKPFFKSTPKSIFSDKPINGTDGLGSCMFLNTDGPALPLSDDYKGGFLCLGGKVYDEDGNLVDFEDEE